MIELKRAKENPILSPNRDIVWGSEAVFNPGAGGTIYLFDINSSTTTFIGGGTQPRIDGDNVVYQKFPSPRDIYLYNISTGQTTLISTNGDSWPYISGNDIVYQGGNTLYHYGLNSEIETVLVSTTVPFRGSLSGGIVAYDERRDGLGGQDHDAYVYTLSTGIEKRLTSQSGGELGNISISGNRVVWTDTDDYNLYLYDLTTEQLTQLTSDPSQQYHSYIDGNRIVWADGRDSGSGTTDHNIYLLEL